MFKYLSMFLAFCLLVMGGVLFYQNRVHTKEATALENELSKLQGIVKETETAYSRQAIELGDLKVKNSELQKVIKDKDETIFAISQVALKLKDKAFEDRTVVVTIVDPDGEPTTVPAGCEDCLKSVRLRVDFDEGDDLMRVAGYTLTNPGYAQVDVKWQRPLRMNLVLTKTKGENFKIYVDSGSDAIPSKLDLRFDPSVFESKWYEKIYVGGGINVGKGIATSVGLGYEITDSFRGGPNVLLFWDANLGFHKMYGVNVQWNPFK